MMGIWFARLPSQSPYKYIMIRKQAEYNALYEGLLYSNQQKPSFSNLKVTPV